MTFLQGLHGTIAAVLICSLLLLDEAGLPLPIAPSEVLLLLVGVLVSSDAFPLWVIAPAAYLAMAVGMLTGYGWARTIGQNGLQSLAIRVRAQDVYEQARTRLKSAGPRGIAVARLIPGLRPYATLVCGAAEVDLRTFLAGALPALLVWEMVWILIGILVGLPVAHLLGRFERVVVRGAILIGLGTVAWLAVRDLSDDRRAGIARIAPRLRASLALIVDATIVASLVGGLFAIARRIMQVTTDAWIELVVAAVLLLALLLIGRSAQTPGETLFETHYWHRSHVSS